MDISHRPIKYRRQTEHGYRPRPYKCDCFGGFCYRGLCAAKHRCGADRHPDIDHQPAPDGTTWRADGSHGNGPVPPGRIPDGY